VAFVAKDVAVCRDAAESTDVAGPRGKRFARMLLKTRMSRGREESGLPGMPLKARMSRGREESSLPGCR
jgi:hypothetical protein